MGAVADFLKNQGLSGNGVTAVEKVEVLFGAVSGISGYVGVLTSLFGSEDAVKTAVDQILNSFKEALKAEDLKSDMVQVGNALAYARTVFSQLRESPPPNPSGDPMTWPMWPDVQHDSQLTLNMLVQEGYWLRPFLGIEYQDLPWTFYWPLLTGQKMTPPNAEAGLVFDYRITLPAFLEAISIRLIIVQSMVKDWQDNEAYRSEFAGWASTLRVKLDTIRDGIQEIQPPTLEMVVGGVVWPPRPPSTPSPFGPPQDTRPPDRYWWMGIGGRFGAVEIYSTIHAVDQWPAGHWPNEDMTPKDVNGYYDAFRISHLIGTMARWKRVSNQIGLPQAENVLAQLNTLLGETATPRRDPVTGLVDRRSGNWSVLELVQRLQSYKLTKTGTDLGLVGTLGAISLRNLLKTLWEVSFNHNAGANTSLRTALAWP